MMHPEVKKFFQKIGAMGGKKARHSLTTARARAMALKRWAKEKKVVDVPK
jgi:hypothetical protein